MVLPQFQYKDRLDLSDRLAIAQPMSASRDIMVW